MNERLEVIITANLDEFKKAMKEAGLSVDELGEKGSGANSKLKSAFGSIGSAAAKCGKAVATGLAVGITALAGLVAKSVEAAGELE